MTEKGKARVPLLTSLAGYQRTWLVPDMLAALTLLVIAVPEQLATSRLAGMPPITGLYAFVAGSVAFALIGSNPQLSVGADSTIAPLFAVALAHLAPMQSTQYVALAGILAVTVGIFVATVGLLRMGWIADFLSTPIITGFMVGVAIIIVVHQLTDVLGLPSVSGTTFHRIATVVRHLGDANGWTVAIAAGVLLVVVGAERVNKRVPGALIGLVGSTALVAGASLRGHGVAVIGAFAHGAPHWGLSGLTWGHIGSVVPVAAVVALVVISQSAATSRAFADQGEYEIDIARDFVGAGAGSIVAGLSGSFPVNASPARTAAIATVGGKSQLSGLAAAAVVVLLVPAAGALHDVPVATLGAILIFVASRIFHWRDILAIAHFDRFELGLAVVTAVTVAFVGVQQGIGLAVALAILDRTRLSSRPSVHLLGRFPGTTSWGPVGAGGAAEVPGVKVVLFAAPLYYANSQHFRAQLDQALAVANPPHALVLDVIGMHDIDFTGTRVLGRLLDEIEKHNVTVGIARAGSHLLENLERGGILARIGPNNLFDNVEQAVTALSGPAPRA